MLTKSLSVHAMFSVMFTLNEPFPSSSHAHE